MIEPQVEKVLAAVPELSPRYCELVEDADDDPGAAAVFEELALFLTDLLRDPGGGRLPGSGEALVERALDAVEAAAGGPDAEELVCWSFLWNLGGPELSALRPLMGRRTLRLLDEIGDG